MGFFLGDLSSCLFSPKKGREKRGSQREKNNNPVMPIHSFLDLKESSF